MSTIVRELSGYRIPFRDRIARIEHLRQFLMEYRNEVLDILTDVASYSSAEEELEAAIKALKGAELEVETQQPHAMEQMAVFMPSNIILYSYVLYLVIPSLYAKQISFRPASYVTEQLARLHALLAPVHELHLHIQCVSQRVFVEESVQSANVVVFTGAYANAEKIKAQLQGNQVFIFFGQGVNPFIVSESADIDAAVQDLVKVRMFNTGQDCMGPDAIFVQQPVTERFLHTLYGQLQKLVFGSRKDPTADYCPIYYPSTLDIVSKYFISNGQFIRFGGVIDYLHQRIEPTVLYSSVACKPEIVEFFGPIFNVVSYSDEDVLRDELDKDFYKRRAMGASVYGSERLADFLRPRHTVSVNSTLFDIEDGNSPFGGYGSMANYAYYQGEMKIAPILISQVVSNFL